MKVILFMLALVPLAGCQSGSITVTGTARPPIQEVDVQVYAEPPAEYEVIALLESAPGSGWSQQAQRDSAIQDLKRKAASVGANGILITGSTHGGSSSGVGVGMGGGHGGVGVGFSRSSQALLANAIFVKPEANPQ